MQPWLCSAPSKSFLVGLIVSVLTGKNFKVSPLPLLAVFVLYVISARSLLNHGLGQIGNPEYYSHSICTVIITCFSCFHSRVCVKAYLRR